MPSEQRKSGVSPPFDCSGSDLSDVEIVDRVLLGETALFELLMRRHNQRLFRVARSVLADDAAAEDAVQESYLRAYSGLARFERRARFSTWITRITVNAAIDERRQRDRSAHIRRSRMDEPIDSTLGNAEHAASNQELRALLHGAVDALPEPLRIVFVLREVEGLGVADTAACVGISESNVKVRLHRARAELRARIDEQIGADIRSLFAFDGARCDRLVERVMRHIRSSVV